MLENTKQAAEKSSMERRMPPGAPACTPEGVTSTTISNCESNTEEIYERLQQLADMLKPVLETEHMAIVSNDGADCRPPLPPMAERLYRHNDRLRSCVSILTEIRDRLAL